MIDFSNIRLTKMAIHKVGNKSRAEKNFFSETLYVASASIEDRLLPFFINPMKKLEETYHFIHLEDNALFKLTSNYFSPDLPEEEGVGNFLEKSQRIARHLYDGIRICCRASFIIRSYTVRELKSTLS